MKQMRSSLRVALGIAIWVLVAVACSQEIETALGPEAKLEGLPELGFDIMAEPERCDLGDATAVFQNFYPGIFAVNTFGLDENGEVIWIVEREGALGHGVVHCQYRTFAATASHLLDSYEFCAHDVFLGGDVYSAAYKHPETQALLDILLPDFDGTYRQKAIVLLSAIREEVRLIRQTYFDADGIERSIGDGGPGDPAATDPSAGDPKLQEMMATGFRDFFDRDPSSPDRETLVLYQWGYFGQLDAGTYQSLVRRYVNDVFLDEFPPVELVILPCGP